MPQAEMIYPQKNVAAMIAGRLSKSKGVPYEVTKVTTGFRVAPVAPAAPSGLLQVLTAKMEAIGDFGENLPPALGTTCAGEFTIMMSLKSEGKEWIHAVHQGKSFWVCKKSLIGWDDMGDKIKLKMTTKYAAKRGLIVH